MMLQWRQSLAGHRCPVAVVHGSDRVVLLHVSSSVVTATGRRHVRAVLVTTQICTGTITMSRLR